MSTSNLLARSLPEQIAELLRNDLLCGRLQPGELVREGDLIKRFEVSRTPVRTALVQLTQEGLLESRSHSSVRVASGVPIEILDLIIAIRQKIEVFALRSFFAEIDENDFKKMEKILELLKGACVEKDYPSIAEQDLAFHRFIIQRCEYADLDKVWLSIFSRIRCHFLESQRKYPDAVTIYEDHVKVVEAFRSGDIEVAAKALEDNIE